METESLFQKLPPIERDKESYTFEGLVRLTVKQGPWKLLFHLRGISIGPRHVMAELGRKEIERDMKKDDVDQLFTRSQRYSLQIESPAPHLPSPVMPVKLREWTSRDSGLKMLFTIPENSEDLDLLLEELKSKNHASHDWLQ